MAILRNLKTNEILEVASKKVIIGRHSADDMTINDAKCSRGNTEIEYVDGRYFIRDRGSRNGTFLNNAQIHTRTPLNYGDKILIGTTEIEFQKSPEKINIEITGYDIIEHIASGGMGKVYKAKQNSLDRIVALKVLSPKLTNNPRLTESFINEARAAGRLNHPNLVQVHDVNKDFQRNGQVTYYFTMEFVDGKTLKELIRETEKLPSLQVVDLLIEITKGLEYIHSNNIIHRDIKPDNIMIDRDGNLKIADLGIALDTTENEISDNTIEPGQKRIVGTPHYISPEQIRGKDIDARSDIYSLGATAFHMLTGETPFEGGTSKDIIKKHILEEPRDLHALNPEIPIFLVDLIKRMMSKKPEERPQTVVALREELEAIKAKLEKVKSRTRIAKSRSNASNAFIYFTAILIGLSIAAGYFWFTELRTTRKASKHQERNNTKDDLPDNVANLIQTKIHQAEDFYNSQEYQKALDIYNTIKTQYPDHQIITEVDALIKKINNEIEKQNQLKLSNKITSKYNEIMASKTQLDAEQTISQLDNFIKTYPEAPETIKAKEDLRKIRNERARQAEIQKLEELKRQIESAQSDETKLQIIKENIKQFRHNENITWLNQLEKELNTKLEILVANAEKDAQSLDGYLNNDDYTTAIERAKKYQQDYTYQKAQTIINKKVEEIEKKADNLKESILTGCQENLKNLAYSEILFNESSKGNKLKGTKAYDDFKRFVENIEMSKDLHEKIGKMLDGKTNIEVNYTETEGPFDVQYRVQQFQNKVITFVYNKPKEKDELTRSITWAKLDKGKLYLVYESILKFYGRYDEYKKSLDAFYKIHNLSTKDLDVRNK